MKNKHNELLEFMKEVKMLNKKITDEFNKMDVNCTKDEIEKINKDLFYLIGDEENLFIRNRNLFKEVYGSLNMLGYDEKSVKKFSLKYGVTGDEMTRIINKFDSDQEGFPIYCDYRVDNFDGLIHLLIEILTERGITDKNIVSQILKELIYTFFQIVDEKSNCIKINNNKKKLIFEFKKRLIYRYTTMLRLCIETGFELYKNIKAINPYTYDDEQIINSVVLYYVELDSRLKDLRNDNNYIEKFTLETLIETLILITDNKCVDEELYKEKVDNKILDNVKLYRLEISKHS